MNAKKRGVAAAWAAAVPAALVLAMIVGIFAAPAAAQRVTTEPAGVGAGGRQARPKYPLKLVFATQTGAYVAGVDVRIYETGGKKVVETHSPGPWLFVDLPQGTFRVVASVGPGRDAEAEVTLNGGGRQKTVYLTWP